MGEWRHAKIADLCQIIKGETGLAKATPGPYPLVATGAERRSCTTWQFDTDAVCIPLVSSTGHGRKTLNYVHYQSGKFALGTILAAVIPKDPSVLTARFLHLYLSHFKDTVLVPLMKGAANVSLPMKEIATVEIPVPPLDEQQSLIDLIFRIEDEHGELLSETNRQSDLLKQLRQAVLQEAVEGKLTAEWRKQHPVVKGDPHYDAVALLAQIKAEKERLVKEGEIRKEKPLPPITDADKPFDLPDGWVWCRLGEVVELITKGSSPGWQGVSYVEKDNGVLFITSKNVGSYSLDLTDTTYVERSFNDIEPRSVLKTGDVLTNIVGASIGRTAIYNLDEIANINQAVCLIRYSHDLMIKLYFLHWMNSDWIISKMHEDEFAPGRANLSMGNVAQFPIPLPPLAEQQAIVARVDRLMAEIDELEKQVAERKEQAQLLMQTVLREAFDGDATGFQ